MGFRASDFYCDDDVGTEKHLNDVVKAGLSDINNLILPYLTLIAPGGTISKDSKNDLKRQFRKTASADEPFDKIDYLFSEWVSSHDLNQEDLVKGIYTLLQNPTDTWVGYDDGSGFPQSGFFVEREFTEDEFIKEHT